MRRQTKEVKIGSVTIGGENPIAIQSMLCAPLGDLAANARQTKDLYEAMYGRMPDRPGGYPCRGRPAADTGYQGGKPDAPGGGYPV